MEKVLSWLLFSYLVVFPFGQLGRFELGAGVNLHLVDLLAGAVTALWVGTILRERKISLPPLARPMLSFAAVAFFSLLVNAYRFQAFEIFAGSLYLLRWVSYALFYFAVWNLLSKVRLRNQLLRALLVVGGAVSVFGWLQYHLLPDIRPLLEFGWDEHYARLVGTFLDPAFTGILLVFFLMLLLSRKWSREGKRAGLLLFLLGFSALALTYSRASYLAFVAGLATLYIVRRNLFAFAGGVVLLLAVIALLPRPGGEGVDLSRTSTIEARIDNQQEALQIALKNPLVGVGFNLLRFERGALPDARGNISHSAAGVDSSPLFVFATTGVLGLISYTWLWWRILVFSWQNRDTEQGLILLSSSFASLVHSLFNNTLFYPWVMGWIALLLGAQGARGYSKR